VTAAPVPGPEGAAGASPPSGAEPARGPLPAPPAQQPGLNGESPPPPLLAGDGAPRLPAPAEPVELASDGEQHEAEAEGGKKGRRKSTVRTLVEWVLVLGGALGAALLIQAVFLKAFYIPSGSMEPTLAVDDRVLVNKLSYDFGHVQRGDIIVFHKPPGAPESDVNDFIKRVVAIEGDTIEAREGVVFLNGQPLDEGYLADDGATLNLPLQEIPEDHVFVMGDNRAHSVDSRVFGPIAESSIVGEAIFRVWPVTDLGRI
jgi:signal peptidase I